MAWAPAATFSGGGKRATSLLDRAVNDLSDTAHGFFPGLLSIGQAAIHDSNQIAHGKMGGFALDDIGKGMAKGFWDSSFIPALATGHPLEALHRASDRPFSAALDATLAFPAYTGAGRFSARLGQALGDTDLIEAGARMQGFTKAPELMRDHTRNVNQFLANADYDVNLPKTSSDMLAQYDGLLTREHNPFTSGKWYGDDLFVRRGQRTLPFGPSRATETEEGTAQAASMMEDFRNSTEFLNPTGTLGEDRFRDLTTYRSKNPLLAAAGDSFYEKIADKPYLNKFTSGRIGRKIVQGRLQNAQTDADQASIGLERLRKAYRDELRAQVPQYSDLSDVELNNLISRRDVLRGLTIDGGNIVDLQRRFDPLDVYRGSTPDEFREMPISEALDRGYHFENNDPDFQMNLADYKTVGDYLDDPEIKARLLAKSKDGLKMEPSIRISVRSAAHRHAIDDVKRAIEDGVINSSPSLQKAQENGHMPIWTLGDEEISGSTLSDDAIRAMLEKVADGHSVDFKFIKHDPVGLQRDYAIDAELQKLDRQLGDDAAPGPAEGIREEIRQGDVSAIRQAIAEVRAARGRLNNFENHSRHELANTGLYRDVGGPYEMRSIQDVSRPGIVDKLQSFLDDELLPLMPQGSDASNAYLAHIDDMVKRGGKNWQDLLPMMLDDARIIHNEQRGSEWLHGEANPEGKFIPLQRELGESHGRLKTFRDRDVVPEVSQLHENPGDPHELLLSGDFRTDANLIDDYFRDSVQKLAGEQIMADLKKMAMPLHAEALEKARKSSHVVTSDEYRAGKKSANFVMVDRNDFVFHKFGKMADEMEEAKQIVSDANPEAAAAFDPAIEAARQFQHTLQPKQAKIGTAMKSPEVTKKAVTDDHGYILPVDVYDAALKELEGARASMGAMWKTVQDGWKFMVLHTRFASWMRNNIIGAHLMAAMSRGPMNYLKHMVNLADPEYKAAYDALESVKNADVLQSGSAKMARDAGRLIKDPSKAGPIGKAVHQIEELKQKGSDFNAKWADDPMRKFHMLDQMNDVAKQIEDSLGIKVEMNEEFVNRILNDEPLRKEIARRTGVDLVDFGNVGSFEKKWLQSVFPFYSWMKGSSKATQRLAADEPLRVAAMGSIGEQGSRYAHEQGGKFLPDFAKDFFDPGAPGGFALSTAGFFPYMTPVDFGTLGASLVPDLIPGDKSNAMSYNVYGSENLLSQMNPILSAFAQSALGKNAYFGTPLPNNSFGSNLMQSQAGLPLLKLAEDLIMNETTPTATTRKSRFGTLLNYAAFPIKDPRRGQIIARGVDELNERYKNPAAINELLPS